MIDNKLKKMIIFSSLEIKELIDARINAIAEIRKTSASKVYEAEFSKLFIPENPILRRYAEIIYLHDDGIKDALKTFFDENRSTEKPLKFPKYQPIVQYMYDQEAGIRITDFEYLDDQFIIFKDEMINLTDFMLKKSKNMVRNDSISIEREIQYIQSLFVQVEDDPKNVKPSLFTGWLIRNWNIIGDYPYTIDILTLVLNFQTKYRESGEAKEKLLAVLTEVITENDS